VSIGTSVRGRTEILSGLKEGERIVASGQFMLDSEILDPTLTLIENLKGRFAESKLSPILEQAETAISGAKENKTGEPLAAQLSQLMTALDSWLTLGAPAHYKSKGLIFYSDDETARLWLSFILKI